ncbi:MAG: serine hydrolase [Anaerolineae bacterium]|nr:serine hydrolase [Anaerolineae bacterium]
MKVVKWLGIAVLVFVGVIALALVVASVVYTPEYVYRVLVWQDSDAFDWQKFPNHPVSAAPAAYHFDEAPDPRVADLFAQLSAAEDWDSFLAANNTQAFIVIQDGKILYENYFNDTQRDSIVTSFSVAKSFTSALIGIAIEEGFIDSVDDSITTYLPELAQRDPRFNQITIRDVLLMASGRDYQELRSFLFNGDDPLTTYYPINARLPWRTSTSLTRPGPTSSTTSTIPKCWA